MTRLYSDGILYGEGQEGEGNTEKNKLIVCYDKEADVAYLSFGEPKPSVTEELDDYVLVRRDPRTREVRWVTITNFSRYFSVKKEMKVEIPEP